MGAHFTPLGRKGILTSCKPSRAACATPGVARASCPPARHDAPPSHPARFPAQVIWGPWDRETSTMRFSLTMAALNLIIKPFLTPAMLELVKRNGSGASGAGFPGGSRCVRTRNQPPPPTNEKSVSVPRSSSHPPDLSSHLAGLGTTRLVAAAGRWAARRALLLRGESFSRRQLMRWLARDVQALSRSLHASVHDAPTQVPGRPSAVLCWPLRRRQGARGLSGGEAPVVAAPWLVLRLLTSVPLSVTSRSRMAATSTPCKNAPLWDGRRLECAPLRMARRARDTVQSKRHRASQEDSLPGAHAPRLAGSAEELRAERSRLVSRQQRFSRSTPQALLLFCSSFPPAPHPLPPSQLFGAQGRQAGISTAWRRRLRAGGESLGGRTTGGSSVSFRRSPVFASGPHASWSPLGSARGALCGRPAAGGGDFLFFVALLPCARRLRSSAAWRAACFLLRRNTTWLSPRHGACRCCAAAAAIIASTYGRCSNNRQKKSTPHTSNRKERGSRREGAATTTPTY